MSRSKVEKSMNKVSLENVQKRINSISRRVDEFYSRLDGSSSITSPERKQKYNESLPRSAQQLRSRSGTSGTGMEARLLSTLLNEIDGVGTLANIYQSAGRNTNPPEQGNNGEQLMRDDCGSAHLENEETSVNTQKLKVISSSTVKDVLIVAATNRPDAIHKAVLRPGRIDRIIYIPPPNVEARLQILRVHTRASPLAEDVDFEEFALNTELFSGAEFKFSSFQVQVFFYLHCLQNIQADLEDLCREAALYALEDGSVLVGRVEHNHFMAPLSTVKPSLTTA